MAYVITRSCSGKDGACQAACPFDCIQTMPGKKANGRQYFMIDQETCTDCGACALACPEQAIAYGSELVRYQKPTEEVYTGQELYRNAGTFVGSIGGWNGVEEVYVKVGENQPLKKVKLPEGYVVVGDKLEPWARLMAACGN